MVREFVYTEPFRKCWKSIGLDDDDLLMLENMLLADPRHGDVIEGLDGARKLRIRLSGRGKRGGGRVIYLDILEIGRLYFLFAYPKNVREDLSSEQKRCIRMLIEAIAKEGL